MKKLLSICLAIIMVMCVSVTALAEENFVQSPPAYNGPEIVDVQKDEDCDSKIVIAPKDSEDMTDELKELAEQAGVDPADLTVSEFFNVSIEGCDDHTNHGAISLTIRPSSLNNFFDLLAFQNGKWSSVKDLKLDNAKGTLTFTANSFGPYAIVLSKAKTSPQTSSNAPVATSVVALVSVAGLIVLAKSKKSNA